MYKSKSTVVTSKGEANATIIVKVGNQVVGFGKIDENIEFSVKIFEQKAGTVLNFYLRVMRRV
jgi:hypothetical protein